MRFLEIHSCYNHLDALTSYLDNFDGASDAMLKKSKVTDARSPYNGYTGVTSYAYNYHKLCGENNTRVTYNHGVLFSLSILFINSS